MRRKTRLARLSTMLVATIGLIGTSAPPASAQSVFVFTFVGVMGLNAPIGVPNPTNGLPFPPTVPPGLHCNLPLGDITDLVPFTNCHPNWGGHTRGILTFASTACFGGGATTGKVGKQPVSVGACGFNLAAGKVPEGNHLHGYCTVSGGQLQVTYTSPEPQNYAFDIHFSGIANMLVVTGHWRKGSGQRGLLIGVMTIAPIPPQNLLDNTARTFTVLGNLSGLPV